MSERRVRVQPGVVLDQLNRVLATRGLIFGPDVATASRATLGGMIGNNSAGSAVRRVPANGRPRSPLGDSFRRHTRGILAIECNRIRTQAGAADARRRCLPRRGCRCARPRGRDFGENTSHYSEGERVQPRGGFLQESRDRRREAGNPVITVPCLHCLLSPVSCLLVWFLFSSAPEGTPAVIAEAELAPVPRLKYRGLLAPQ